MPKESFSAPVLWVSDKMNEGSWRELSDWLKQQEVLYVPLLSCTGLSTEPSRVETVNIGDNCNHEEPQSAWIVQQPDKQKKLWRSLLPHVGVLHNLG